MEGDLTGLFQLVGLNPMTTAAMVGIVLALTQAIKIEIPKLTGNWAKFLALGLSATLSLKVCWGLTGLNISAFIISTILVYLGSRGIYKLIPNPPQS